MGKTAGHQSVWWLPLEFLGFFASFAQFDIEAKRIWQLKFLANLEYRPRMRMPEKPVVPGGSKPLE